MNIDVVTCKQCNRKIKYGKPTCYYCGAKLEHLEPSEITTICNQCNKANPVTNKICMNCGKPLSSQVPYLTLANTIPELPSDISINEKLMWSIIFTNEGMDIEKTEPGGLNPHFYKIPWHNIREINVYRKEKEEIKKVKEGKSFESIIGHSREYQGVLSRSVLKEVEVIEKKEIFLCEILTETVKELIIADKINYAKALANEREYNVMSNFYKFIKKIISRCNNIEMNRGTSLILSKN
jgi:hypothetical protein